ncbi:hypothetical protein [Ornithinimicrobium tianjinense]|uniref:PH domain-containing protein n=1 Tax=Ornithinimicrobium tianjinense TaxID=1195761 RepID=A0A917BRL6_9MICO|nr:hypothetical protein [Ornithinimicrobium tianjinense]GGF56170.1 hypothetical protein GCM10011366_25080 [Ornithinimicrobium tianjinense]
MTTAEEDRGEWLMQPRWVPLLRAALGCLIGVSALAALVLARPTHPAAVVLTLAALGLGVFLMWAGRFERSGTRLDPDALTVIEGRRPRRLSRADVLDVRGEPAGGIPWRVVAVLRDGEEVTLLGVPPAELDRLRRWHTGT